MSLGEVASLGYRLRVHRWIVFACVGLAVTAGLIAGLVMRSDDEDIAQIEITRPPPEHPLRYGDVQAVFEERCAACHDKRKSSNAAPQRIFEMSSYPFATARPATLLSDLRKMFEHRGGLSDDDRWRGINWVDAGGLDAEGKPPRWR